MVKNLNINKRKQLNIIKDSNKSLDIVDEVLTPLGRKKSQDLSSHPKDLENGNFSKFAKQAQSENDGS